MLYRPIVSTCMNSVSEHVTYVPYSRDAPNVVMYTYDNKTL